MSALTIALISAAAMLVAEPPAALEGKLREVGGGPGGVSQLLLETEAHQSITLHAAPALLDELRRLAGTRIRIFGADPAQQVSRYEILDVGGGTAPRIGTLAELTMEGGQKRLIFVETKSGAAELLPAAWTKKLGEAQLGSKIWLVGSGDQPRKFGILRAGPEREP